MCRTCKKHCGTAAPRGMMPAANQQFNEIADRRAQDRMDGLAIMKKVYYGPKMPQFGKYKIR